MEIEEAAPQEKKKPSKSSKKLQTSSQEEDDNAKQLTICYIPGDITSQDSKKLLIFISTRLYLILAYYQIQIQLLQLR